MKILMNEEINKKRIGRMMYRMPVELMLIAYVVILGYHAIRLFLDNDISSLGDSELLASTFFYGTAAGAVIYFAKSKLTPATLGTVPSDTTEGEIDFYLPGVVGNVFGGFRAGLIIIQGKKMIFNEKKAGGFVKTFIIDDITGMTVEYVRVPKYITSRLVWGYNTVIRFKKGDQVLDVVYYQAEEGAKEVREVLKTLL